MDYTDPDQAAWALQDSSTPGEVLVSIAQMHPGLRDRVVTHPNTYPQLVAWIAAQAKSAGGASVPRPSVAGPSYGPQQQPYGAPAQPYQMPPGQHGPGGYRVGPSAKKKTGLVVGLVGGGVVAVVAVVAVLGLFVFHWFGDSSGSGPTLTKSQAESFLDSDFVQDLSGGTSTADFHHSSYDASDFGGNGLSQACQDVVDLTIGADDWSSSSITVQRYPDKIALDSTIDAIRRCEGSGTTLEGFSIDKRDGGWLVTSEDEDGAMFVYGNVWVMSGVSSDEAQGLFKDFVSAVDAAAK